MAVLQHYYTSYVNEQRGSVGFQVKAMSPGISSETQTVLLRILSYEIPGRLDKFAIAEHPQALRYLYRNPQEAILLCSQSNGPDRNGRPGNFFAHSLVLHPDEFANLPPIFYWGNPLWQSNDLPERADEYLAPLPSLAEVEATVETEHVYEQTWSFLAQGQRCEQFRQLMAAVIQSQGRHRRVVIIDDACNVAHWITAITLMLPPAYRHLLSFATYDHDPYQSQFLVTGTTSDSQFRARPDEYTSFFILNSETGQMSDVDPSPYADQAWQAAQDYHYYEQTLLGSTMDYAAYFPQPACIDEVLDALVLYSGLFDPTHGSTLSSAEVQAVQRVLDELERVQAGSLNRQEIQHLEKALQASSEHDTEADRAHQRVITLYQKHGLAIKSSALRWLQMSTRDLMANPSFAERSALLERMRTRYGENLFLGTVNSPGYLDWLNREIRGTSLVELQALWVQLGTFLSIGPQTRPFFLALLNAAARGGCENRTNPEVENLYVQLVETIEDRQEALPWLKLMVASAAHIDDDALLPVYHHLVAPLDLEQRLPYRDLLRTLYPAIEQEELTHELTSPLDATAALEKFKAWIAHAHRQRLDVLTLQQTGLETLEEYYPTAMQELSVKILQSQELAPLPPAWQTRFLHLAMSGVSFATTTRATLELFQHYQQDVQFEAEVEVVMHGLQAMESGELTEQLALHLAHYFSQPQRQRHLAREYARFVPAFLATCRSDRAHGYLVRELFTQWEQQELFWEPYWDELMILLTGREGANQALKLLNFWFVVSPTFFTTCAYTWHYVFLNLPHYLDQARKQKGFLAVARDLQETQQQWPWFPLLQEHLAPPQSAVGQASRKIAAVSKLFQRSSDDEKSQRGREADERMALQGQMRLLVHDRHLRKAHLEKFRKIYQHAERRMFWEVYLEQIKILLYTEESDELFELLAFWFNDACDHFHTQALIPQQFFLELAGLLEQARDDRRFRMAGQKIRARGSAEAEKYPWFHLIAPFVAEQERGFSLF
jgi:hypothetical protein